MQRNQDQLSPPAWHEQGLVAFETEIGVRMALGARRIRAMALYAAYPIILKESVGLAATWTERRQLVN
jgi:hypothetical protein